MKTILRLFAMACALMFCFNHVQAAPGADDESGFQLTVEMRDGSRVVGKTLEDALSFHSAVLGEMKLSWAGIRSIDYAASPDAARLTATNGDAFTIQPAADILRLEAGFGKIELPVKLIQSVKVSPSAKANLPVASDSVNESVSRLTIELRDGSHVVGRGLDDTLNFHSEAMGDLKLTWAGIRAIEYASASTDTARLTATNNDVYEVQFAAAAVRVETSFGKTELPVKLIRNIKVSAMTRIGQLPSGLVALWSGEGDGNDAVGGNNAMLTDVSFANGKVGQAFSLSGMDSGLNIPASQSLDVGAGDGLTLTAWIKPVNLNLANQWLMGWNSGENGSSLGCVIKLSQTSFGQGTGCLLANIVDINNNSHIVCSAADIVTDRAFQHIALTYDKTSGVATIYCNGVIVAKENLGTFTPKTTYPFMLGTRAYNGGWGVSENGYRGLLDEVAIYNHALSASEIQAICIDQNNGEPLPPPTPSSDAMPFNERLNQNGMRSQFSHPPTPLP